MKLLAVLAMAVLALSGCADSGRMSFGELPISDETVTTLAGDVRDSSVQKEAVYYHAREARDLRYQKMYSQSGTKIKFAMKEVAPGVHIQVMESIESREAPRFDQPLPDGPSVHPVWATANNVINKGFDTAKWVWSGEILGDVVKTGLKYAAKDPLVVKPEVVKVEPFVVEPIMVEVPGPVQVVATTP